MREVLSDLIAEKAAQDPEFLMLSGDHGYALFDKIRKNSPDKFINVGVAEQLMISLAAGLAKVGFHPMVYGLATFVPIRVLEQIKLDLCLAKLPVVMLGDGAGLVYSTLGASHQTGEDLAALQALPNLKIFVPADKHELRAVFREALEHPGPSYIRIGKSDRPEVHKVPVDNSEAVEHHAAPSSCCIVSMGSMLSVSLKLARKHDLRCVGISRLKPFPENFREVINDAATMIVIEEHSRFGGLSSAIHQYFEQIQKRAPLMKTFSLEDHFTERCGSYQYALSEHRLSDKDLETRLTKFLKELQKAKSFS